jgi:hypothetical protein
MANRVLVGGVPKLSIEHDLFRKAVLAFRDHAQGGAS